MLSQFINFPSFTNYFDFQNHEGDESSSHFYNKALMTGVALGCLGLVTWKVIQQQPWTALAVGVGGICIEVALKILWPSRSSAVVSDSDIKPVDDQPVADSLKVDNFKIDNPKTKDILTSTIKHLEASYPVKAIDPVHIRDMQEGGMMGQACGDAIGLFTEFTTKKEAQEMIGGKPIEFGPDYPDAFKNGYNWSHIKRFIKNGWTDDTDQALSLLRALYRHMKQNTHFSFDALFAVELKKWRNHGLRSEEPFIGRSNPYCMGLGALVSAVLQKPIFLKDPKGAAEEVWAKNPEEALQSRPAANGAIMRTAPIGLIFYRSLEDVVKYTIEACNVTHVDPRCTASCVALTLAIALSLRGYKINDIFEAAEEGGLAVLRQEIDWAAKNELLSKDESKDLDSLYEACAKEFTAHMYGDWETLDLDENYRVKDQINKIGYTLKCMGAAFYCLSLANQYQTDKKADVFRLVIEELAGEGGDADTNGAAAGALLGAYLGFKGQFPSNWTTQLADVNVLNQAIQHVGELTLQHQQNLDKKAK